MDKLEAEILKTLSFFDPMNLEKIILDFDQKFTLDNPDFNREQLFKCLESLVAQKKVKTFTKEKEQFWIKQMKKRTLWQRILLLFS